MTLGLILFPQPKQVRKPHTPTAFPAPAVQMVLQQIPATPFPSQFLFV